MKKLLFLLMIVASMKSHAQIIYTLVSGDSTEFVFNSRTYYRNYGVVYYSASNQLSIREIGTGYNLTQPVSPQSYLINGVFYRNIDSCGKALLNIVTPYGAAGQVLWMDTLPPNGPIATYSYVQTLISDSLAKHGGADSFWTAGSVDSSVVLKPSVTSVGIGTTTPLHNLHVAGDFLAFYNNPVTGGYSAVFVGDGRTAGVDPTYIGAGSCGVLKGDSAVHIIANYIQLWALNPIDTGNFDVVIDSSMYIRTRRGGSDDSLAPGKVQIGLATRPEKIAILDGTQGIGKVLTSDASGNASWQSNSGGSLPQYQIGVGTGSGIAGYGQFVFNIGSRMELDGNSSANITINDTAHGSSLTLLATGQIQFANSGIGNNSATLAADSLKSSCTSVVYQLPDDSIACANGQSPILVDRVNGVYADRTGNVNLTLNGATGSEPSNHYLGQFYFDTTLVKMKFWNGTAWAVITSTP